MLIVFFDVATSTEIYTLSLHDALPISYYAFFSIFPLLLVFTTVLGYVLGGHGHLYKSLVDSALGQFPVIGRQLHTRSEEHTSELQSHVNLVCRLLLEKKQNSPSDFDIA